MCNNCMVYNQPETIFYKEAARIMGMGGKQLSKVNVPIFSSKSTLDVSIKNRAYIFQKVQA